MRDAEEVCVCVCVCVSVCVWEHMHVGTDVCVHLCI